MLQTLGDPVSLENFQRLHERNISFTLIDFKVKFSDPVVQRIIENEREMSSAEWLYFKQIHKRAPDEQFSLRLLNRFKEEQLPLIVGKTTNLGIDFFVKNVIENVENSETMNKEKFSDEQYQFILSSEKYYAEKYFQEHSNVDLGYKDLDIRVSQKAQVKGLHECQLSFESRYNQLYTAYERNNDREKKPSFSIDSVRSIDKKVKEKETKLSKNKEVHKSNELSK
jgi:hypothetical protein